MSTAKAPAAPSGRICEKLTLKVCHRLHIIVCHRRKALNLNHDHKKCLQEGQYNTLFTLAWPSEVLFTLGELYPRQTSQPREDCLGEDLGEGQV